ncbi:hypothetical protein L249_6414, partial [Ophiocordyceps polyrhachis-furcata BCC 54312]
MAHFVQLKNSSQHHGAKPKAIIYLANPRSLFLPQRSKSPEYKARHAMLQRPPSLLAIIGTDQCRNSLLSSKNRMQKVQKVPKKKHSGFVQQATANQPKANLKFGGFHLPSIRFQREEKNGTFNKNLRMRYQHGLGMGQKETKQSVVSVVNVKKEVMFRSTPLIVPTKPEKSLDGLALLRIRRVRQGRQREMWRSNHARARRHKRPAKLAGRTQ